MLVKRCSSLEFALIKLVSGVHPEKEASCLDNETSGIFFINYPLPANW